MHEAVAFRRRLRAWFASPLGSSLLAFETRRLDEVLPHLYGTTALQLGGLGPGDLLAACAAPTHIVHDVWTPPAHEAGAPSRVCGLPEALPYDSRSADLVLLPHTLDFCQEPHQVLREAARVLKPEGHVVILGFNPISLWGLRRLFTRRPRPAPWCGRFFRLARIKDWLGLLDFELTHGRMLYYRPPLARAAFAQRLRFLDQAGDRWWPLMAAVYLVVAKKRVVGVTPLPIEWKDRRMLGSAATEPVTRGLVGGMRRARGRCASLSVSPPLATPVPRG